MGVTFRDEFNEPSFIMIGYSDATVTALNYLLIVRSNASLVKVTAYSTIVVEVIFKLDFI